MLSGKKRKQTDEAWQAVARVAAEIQSYADNTVKNTAANMGKSRCGRRGEEKA